MPQSPVENMIKEIFVQRSAANPLITFETSGTIGDNVCGPSVVRVPSWIENPLGKYYMYFAHHKGKYIRLAYSDFIAGPWHIYDPGTLKLESASYLQDHVASPDVHVDNENKKIIIYFHSQQESRKQQWTYQAFSEDGLHFQVHEQVLGRFYFRVFKWNNFYYALAKTGNKGWGELLRSKDGKSHFEVRPKFMENVRHTAILVRDSHLVIFYTRVGDAPERILSSTVAMDEDWEHWIPSKSVDVIKPEMEYEGIKFPIMPSDHGPAINVHQLRDPCIYEENQKTYLFYTTAGEMGIAMAEIEITMNT